MMISIINSDIIFLSTIFFIISLISYYSSFFLSYKLKILDQPDIDRKIHTKPVPLSGGLYILIFFILFFLIFDLNSFESYYKKYSIFIVIFFFFLFGLADDKFNITPSNKIFVSILLLFFLFSYDNNLLINKIVIHTNIPLIPLNLNLSFLFSIFCFMILLNSFNMIDGLNGTLLANTFGIFTVIFLNLDNYFLFYILFPLIIFIYFNFKNKVFMGSSGNMIISVIAGIFLIQLYNHSNQLNFNFLNIYSLLFVPVSDLIRLFVYRIMKGQSPFSPDNSHIHHILHNKLNLVSINIIFIIFYIPDLLIVFLNFNLDIAYIILLKFIFYTVLIYRYLK